MLNRRVFMTLVVLATAFLSTSCATTRISERVPFYDSMRPDYKLSDARLRTVQFFVSGEIRLTRERVSSSAGVTAPDARRQETPR